MALIFLDSFTGANGTAITSRAPDTGVAWFTVGASLSPLIENNRAHESATGADDYVCAQPAAYPANHDYDVEADVYLASIGATDGTGIYLRSHSDTADAGDGYEASVSVGSGVALVRARKWIGGAQDWAVTLAPSPALAPGDTVHLKIKTRASGGTVDLDFYCQHLGTGDWLKPDQNWQAGEIAFHSRNDAAPLTAGGAGFGTGALKIYDYATPATGFHCDNFTITTAGGAVLDTGTLSNTLNSPTLTQFSLTGPTGGTAPYSSQLKRSPAGAGTYANIGAPQAGVGPAFSDATVLPGVSYDYIVTTTDSVAATADSNVVSLTTGAAASSFAFTGPAGGAVGAPSSSFALTPDGYVAAATVTLNDGGGGGAFTPPTLTWTGESAAKTFTYTPASAGVKTIHAPVTSGAPATVAPATLAFTSVGTSYIVFVGDSNTEGTGGNAPWPDNALLGLGANWSGDNRGAGGMGWAYALTDVPNWVGDYAAGRPYNFVFSMMGTNDLTVPGAGIYSYALDWLAAVRADEPRWIVGLMTLPKSAAAPAHRDEYNALVIGSAIGDGFDFIVDATTDADLEAATPSAWNDGLHLTALGQERLADYVLGAIVRWIQEHAPIPPPPPPPLMFGSGGGSYRQPRGIPAPQFPAQVKRKVRER